MPDLMKPVTAVFVAFLVLAPAGGAAADVTETCNAKDVLPGQIRCFLDAALAAGNAEVCEGAAERTVRFNCISLFAERRDEPGACERIDSTGPENAALRPACIAGVALAHRRPQLCERTGLAAMRDACYAQMVLEAGGPPELCGRIENPVLKSACAAGPAPNPKK